MAFVPGIGILTPFADDEVRQELLMNPAGSIWGGNETWLVRGGAGLMAAFSKACATIPSSLYLLVLAMLIALIFRDVAFKFRFRAHTSRRIWGVAFPLVAVIAAFAQGLMLGAIVEGMPLEDDKYVHGAFAWFSPFSVLMGMAPGIWLWPARRDLAGVEDRTAPATHRPRPDATADAGGGRVHDHGQCVAAVPGFTPDGSLVHLAEPSLPVAAADPDRRGGHLAVARVTGQP
jgi:hypothetical protein